MQRALKPEWLVSFEAKKTRRAFSKSQDPFRDTVRSALLRGD
jgi:hypothetical protein